jgi:hypothetical protein
MTTDKDDDFQDEGEGQKKNKKNGGLADSAGPSRLSRP